MKIHTAYEECLYYTFPSQSPISFLSTGITYPIGSYDYSRKLSTCYSIEYIYQGNGFLSQGYSNIPLEAGDMFVLHPGIPCRYYAESSWKKIWVSVENPGPFMEHLFSDYNLKQCNVLKKIQSPLYLEDIFNIVKSKQYSSPSGIINSQTDCENVSFLPKYQFRPGFFSFGASCKLY